MLAWAGQHAPGRRVWALEGTGSFAAGLAQALTLAGEAVVEVGALKRSRGPKNDRLDAVRAARTAMARDQQASPRARGPREAIRALTATRHAVLVSRTKAINELKSLIVVAPEHLRARVRGCTLTRQLDRIEAMTTHQQPAASRTVPPSSPCSRSRPAPHEARHTATSAAASSAPSPGTSTASWKPQPASTPHLDRT